MLMMPTCSPLAPITRTLGAPISWLRLTRLLWTILPSFRPSAKTTAAAVHVGEGLPPGALTNGRSLQEPTPTATSRPFRVVRHFTGRLRATQGGLAADW